MVSAFGGAGADKIVLHVGDAALEYGRRPGIVNVLGPHLDWVALYAMVGQRFKTSRWGLEDEHDEVCLFLYRRLSLGSHSPICREDACRWYGKRFGAKVP